MSHTVINVEAGKNLSNLHKIPIDIVIMIVKFKMYIEVDFYKFNSFRFFNFMTVNLDKRKSSFYCM